MIASEYADEFRLASPPWPVQRTLVAALTPVGKLFGYRARHPNTASEYSRLTGC